MSVTKSLRPLLSISRIEARKASHDQIAGTPGGTHADIEQGCMMGLT